MCCIWESHKISGGSRTSVGGYAAPEPEAENSAQFDVSDTRSLDEVVAWLMEIGYLPVSVQPAIVRVVLATVL